MILHYATWAENWRAREYYLNWTGGLWVQIGSKNPTDDWSMTLENRKHPILRGVKPWEYRDEIFCRFFLPNDKRRTDLLLATPKEDKPGIGPQIAAWAYQRDDGGRGFVFGGLDFRDNLARGQLSQVPAERHRLGRAHRSAARRHQFADARRQRCHASQSEVAG